MYMKRQKYLPSWCRPSIGSSFALPMCMLTQVMTQRLAQPDAPSSVSIVIGAVFRGPMSWLVITMLIRMSSCMMVSLSSLPCIRSGKAFDRLGPLALMGRTSHVTWRQLHLFKPIMIPVPNMLHVSCPYLLH